MTARSRTAGNLGYQTGFTDPASGLVHMGARWYTPANGQFTSRDTAHVNPVPSEAAANPFAYAAGNPLTGTDPTGHMIVAVGGGWRPHPYHPHPPPTIWTNFGAWLRNLVHAILQIFHRVSLPAGHVKDAARHGHDAGIRGHPVPGFATAPGLLRPPAPPEPAAPPAEVAGGAAADTGGAAAADAGAGAVTAGTGLALGLEGLLMVLGLSGDTCQTCANSVSNRPSRTWDKFWPWLASAVSSAFSRTSNARHQISNGSHLISNANPGAGNGGGRGSSQPNPQVAPPIAQPTFNQPTLKNRPGKPKTVLEAGAGKRIVSVNDVSRQAALAGARDRANYAGGRGGGGSGPPTLNGCPPGMPEPGSPSFLKEIGKPENVLDWGHAGENTGDMFENMYRGLEKSTTSHAAAGIPEYSSQPGPSWGVTGMNGIEVMLVAGIAGNRLWNKLKDWMGQNGSNC